MSAKVRLVLAVVVLVAAGAAYKLVLASPAPAGEAKVAGQVYVLPKDFLVNLADGQFGKVAIGLVLDESQALGGGGHGPSPPEGFGALAQEPLVRDIVTDELTGADAERLTTREGRRALKRELLAALRRSTDVAVHEVLLMDVTVQ